VQKHIEPLKIVKTKQQQQKSTKQQNNNTNLTCMPYQRDGSLDWTFGPRLNSDYCK
jgi:hypothetical protein